jgi:hypothetical protein
MCGLGISLPLLVWYCQGLLAPLVTIIAIYIAWKQWKTNTDKLKLELFDRRYQAFQDVRKILESMFGAQTNSEEMTRFWFATSNVGFLFGPEIKDYRDEILIRGGKLADLNHDLDRDAPGENREELHQERKAQIRWARDQVEIVASKFTKYLNLSEL